MSLLISTTRSNETGEISSYTVIVGDNVSVVHPGDINFKEIAEVTGDLTNHKISPEEAESKMLDLISDEGKIEKVAEEMRSLSDKISTDGYAIYYDGERLDGVAEDEIIAIMNRGGNYGPVVKFVERVYDNVSKYVRDQLFGWLKAFSEDDPENPFHLTEDGKIVGYKGCRIGDDGVTPVSIHFAEGSTGYVDIKAPGETEFTRYKGGNIPYPFGCVAKMERRDCNDDPNTGCSSGLHVGTWEYAKKWVSQNCGQGYVLTVEVDPVDVVSVPSDSAFQKLRACQFRVIGIAQSRMDDVVIGAVKSDLPADDGDDDDEDNAVAICEECGEEYNPDYEGADGLCDDCHSDNFSICEGCYEEFPNEDLNDDGLCDECEDSREDEDEEGEGWFKS